MFCIRYDIFYLYIYIYIQGPAGLWVSNVDKNKNETMYSNSDATIGLPGKLNFIGKSGKIIFLSIHDQFAVSLKG